MTGLRTLVPVTTRQVPSSETQSAKIALKWSNTQTGNTLTYSVLCVHHQVTSFYSGPQQNIISLPQFLSDSERHTEFCCHARLQAGSHMWHFFSVCSLLTSVLATLQIAYSSDNKATTAAKLLMETERVKMYQGDARGRRQEDQAGTAVMRPTQLIQQLQSLLDSSP